MDNNQKSNGVIKDIIVFQDQETNIFEKMVGPFLYVIENRIIHMSSDATKWLFYLMTIGAVISFVLQDISMMLWSEFKTILPTLIILLSITASNSTTFGKFIVIFPTLISFIGQELIRSSMLSYYTKLILQDAKLDIFSMKRRRDIPF